MSLACVQMERSEMMSWRISWGRGRLLVLWAFVAGDDGGDVDDCVCVGAGILAMQRPCSRWIGRICDSSDWR